VSEWINRRPHELLDHFIVALDEGYIGQEQFDRFRAEIFESIKILNGYIRYLQKEKSRV